MNSPVSITFVLVHGAWHGGWCWKKLTPLLRAAGHQVYTPTLTGMGERAHLLASDVDLNTHIEDVNALLEYEDLHDVVLVGHSYGGMVITGVNHSRLVGLVYLDAFLPEHGNSLSDYAPVPPAREDGWRIPSPGTARDMGVTDEMDVVWADARMGDQPVKTFIQPVRIDPDHNEAIKRTFIQCTQAPFFAEAGERAKRQGFHFHELPDAGHDAMISQPSALAQILLTVS